MRKRVVIALARLTMFCVALLACSASSEPWPKGLDRAGITAMLASTNLQMVEPLKTKVDESIRGFSEPNDHLWEVRLVDNSGEPAIIFLWNPRTESIFFLCRMGEWQASKCAGGHGRKQKEKEKRGGFDLSRIVKVLQTAK